MAEKIVISGLTAAGKTTHTKLLAAAYGFRAVHFTDLLLRELGIPGEPDNGIWFSRFREIESMRAGGTIDRYVDEAIGELLANDEPMVVDATLAPWLHPGEQVNIWLGSDRASRAWKCTVSRLPAAISTDDSLRLLDEKDSFTREYLWKERGLDLYVDRSCFDLILDNSHLISEPTQAAADVGIGRLHRVLLACLNLRLWGQADDLLALTETAADELAAIAQMNFEGIELPRSARTVLASRRI